MAEFYYNHVTQAMKSGYKPDSFWDERLKNQLLGSVDKMKLEEKKSIKGRNPL